MAMIAGGPHLSFTAIHELLTGSSQVVFGAGEEQERICQSGMISDPGGQGTMIGNASRHLLLNEERNRGWSQTDAPVLGIDIPGSQKLPPQVHLLSSEQLATMENT